MATDSTDLTFVRCPSCRSLVPAVSTRCRMCGAALDSSAKADALETDDKKSGRVRQRTMSQPQGEAASAIAKGGGEPKPDLAARSVGAVSAAPPVPEDDHISADDPLGAYIEEVEVGEDVVTDLAAKGGPKDRAAAGGSANGSPDGGAPGPAPGADAPPKVILESGVRRMSKSGGLSFGGGRPKEPERRPEPPRQELAQQPQRGQPPPRPEQRQHKSEPPPQAPARETFKGPAPAAGQWKEPVKPDGGESRPQPRPARETPTHEPAPAARPPQRRVEGQSAGRLIGWLVSFTDPDGVATELREGKFFISGTPLKGNDLVINDPGVSTPHALAVASAASGLEVQDLMSDRGVFTRTKGSGAYQKVPDKARLGHGDWVRFGDVEFLVSLIAQVGDR